MRLSTKIYLATGAALLVGGLFFTANHLTSRLLADHGATLDTLGELERLEIALDEELFQGVFLLYTSFDPLHALLSAQRSELERLYLAVDEPAYAEAKAEVAHYAALVDRKEALILRFTTYNALIKNSSSHIPALSRRYLERFGSADTAYLSEIARITALVFQATKSFDDDLLVPLRESAERLAALTPSAEAAQFHHTFLAHTRVIADNFGPYHEALEAIRGLPNLRTLAEAKRLFLVAAEKNARDISHLSLMLSVLFVLCIGFIVFILIRLDREHKQLGTLHHQLNHAATTDPLTGLDNRFAFERAVNQAEHGTLFLLNLSQFGHINDLYGHAVGDQVLRAVADKLRARFAGTETMHLFRIGADEFGLYCHRMPEFRQEGVAEEVAALLEQAELQLGEHRIPLRVTIGLSTERPYLEKAHMALQEGKRGQRKVLSYSAALGLEARVAHNMHILDQIRRAIADDRVVPWFQPILNLSNGRIEKYECLMRIHNDAGEILRPDEFLVIAKEGGLYGELTRIMLDKCIARFRRTHYGFHLNLSINDILDPEVNRHLFARLTTHPEVARRLTLEILESEQVQNYAEVRDFIERVRAFGVSIAIDDFGAGYSNLSHVLHLAVDNLKVDGSLIRDLDRDPLAHALVETLMHMVTAANIRHITAEYVHNLQILEQVRRLGIHYAQGYHIGQPQPELVSVPFSDTDS